MMDQNNSLPNAKDAFYQIYNEHKFFGIIVSKAYNKNVKIKTKITNIVKNLDTEKIDIASLKKQFFEGLPDDVPSLRSLVWKMLLNYLSLNVNDWEDNIDKKRMEYFQYRNLLFTQLEGEKIKRSKEIEKEKEKEKAMESQVEPLNQEFDSSSNSNVVLITGEKEKVEMNDNNTTNIPVIIEPSGNKATSQKKLKGKSTLDHPLSLTGTSKWKSYFEDLELLEEIDKDIRRTRTQMHFFFMPANTKSFSISNDLISEAADKKKNEFWKEEKTKEKAFETNADVMCRILFIYAKRHPDVRYVQGMNEILAPIFYCFSNDQNPYFLAGLEPDSYVCFENLMDEVKDIFMKALDNTTSGIHARLDQLNLMLKIIDKDIYNLFIDQKVEFYYFAFRWYTLFFTQEFEMPDILRLWDSILSDEDKLNFLNMICLAIIKTKRDELIHSEFSEIMLSLQNLETIDVEELIKTAELLRINLNK